MRIVVCCLLFVIRHLSFVIWELGILPQPQSPLSPLSPLSPIPYNLEQNQ
ncbi:MAG: hypothetical protein F6K41_27765 [Symploca sp. SIO3E6]|nr:hypothetical protein [Caldora sp. SIO3E6]